ncbi:gamma-glutamylcyclotransferase [Geodermatophilus sp. CPCC 206100]|uniref:gamma-glutamylcyclotransferase n=1 Tax=Geodermatophilus sp. CPCC 206100 TaxID=3020054 RepID=UPI003AFF7436
MDTVFVYGTLKPGRSRWPALEAFTVPGSARETTLRGRLWETPYGWPALTDGADDVPGVLVVLDRLRAADALARLDAIEGVAVGLFERVRGTTADGCDCWTYRWPGPTAGFTPVDGAW